MYNKNRNKMNINLFRLTNIVIMYRKKVWVMIICCFINIYKLETLLEGFINNSRLFLVEIIIRYWKFVIRVPVTPIHWSGYFIIVYCLNARLILLCFLSQAFLESIWFIVTWLFFNLFFFFVFANLSRLPLSGLSSPRFLSWNFFWIITRQWFASVIKWVVWYNIWITERCKTYLNWA